jgi:hypothetical protein
MTKMFSHLMLEGGGQGLRRTSFIFCNVGRTGDQQVPQQVLELASSPGELSAERKTTPFLQRIA